MFERFRFTGTGEGIAHDVLDQCIYAFENMPVGLLPVQIVFPGVLCEDQLHSAKGFSLPPPFSSSAIDSRSRLALAGTRSRYEVSSSALKSSRESITTESSF